MAYDGWNRLVAVYDDNGNDLIAAYRYDATGRRILKALDDDADDDADGDIDNSGGDRYEHFFHSGQQVIETREATTFTAAPETLNPTYQNVWSLRYIDALILRDTYTSGVIQSGERIFYLTDANYNVTAVVDANGDVVERYVYDAYGNATLLTPTSPSSIPSSPPSTTPPSTPAESSTKKQACISTAPGTIMPS